MDPIARPGSVAARLAATTRVLSVEDEADIAEFLRAYFRASGYDLVHVADDVVTKPFNARTLAGLVAARIEAARAATAPLPAAALADALEDEIASAAARAEPVSFVLFQVRGRDGVEFVRRRIRELLPPAAVVGTGDGDELAVVLPTWAADDALGLAAAIVTDIGGAVDLPGGASVAVAVTAGVASFPDHAATADELFMAADAALASADPVALAI